MFPYVVCFSITIFCAFIDEMLLKNDKKLHYLFAFLVILIPAIFAGCRDYNVGTDVLVYAAKIYDEASSNGWYILLPDYDSRIEIVFLFLAYIASLLFSTASGFLFLISLFINLFIYLALYRMRYVASICMGEFVYLLLYYNETYNLMRQCMAMAVVIFAVTYIFDRQYTKALIWSFLAYFVHHSAIIGLGIVILMLYFRKLETKNSNVIADKRIILLPMVLAVVALFFQDISEALISSGVFSIEFYSTYLEGMGMFENKGFNIQHFLVYYSSVFFLFINYRNIQFFIGAVVIFLCDVSMYYLRLDLVWLYRISTWFFYIRILFLSQMPLSLDLIGKRKLNYSWAITMLFMLSCLVFWYGIYVIIGENETYPYTSVILGI